ncbi:MAG: hypothetical protein WBI99_00010 [Limnochordia bacterium]|jgi:hypothetical protein|nr:hypothetical protein [Limnochordia bacterium]MDI9465877.1 hypothetical protein [Bacillota bacterium]HOB40278.1 hypothetical protein [Limnochordia bacterium]HOK32789.1 hypothetical protein [Limnochordia bacterium]HOM00023.1 hypothetical protein [Limnochordia bacterium]
MKKQRVASVQSLLLGNRQAEKFFDLEKHPRQKSQPYPPIFFPPFLIF